eukprot:GHVP01039988.1.p2 GENE.GHVP01039988.1~~GHVP01039988.1.p2  ORF type:complete len:161 (+),score=16.33 GHVP01039988.1:470-952(+)
MFNNQSSNLKRKHSVEETESLDPKFAKLSIQEHRKTLSVDGSMVMFNNQPSDLKRKHSFEVSESLEPKFPKRSIQEPRKSPSVDGSMSRDCTESVAICSKQTSDSSKQKYRPVMYTSKHKESWALSESDYLRPYPNWVAHCFYSRRTAEDSEMKLLVNQF